MNPMRVVGRVAFPGPHAVILWEWSCNLCGTHSLGWADPSVAHELAREHVGKHNGAQDNMLFSWLVGAS